MAKKRKHKAIRRQTVANVQSSRFKLCISVFIANFPGPASSEITSQVNEIPRSLSLLSVYCNHSPPHMESMSFQPRRNLLQKNFSWASAVYPTTRECLPRMGIQSPCTCHCRRLPSGGVAISECVGVGVDIRWPDMSSRHPVRRRTDEDELKNITPLKDRKCRGHRLACGICKVWNHRSCRFAVRGPHRQGQSRSRGGTGCENEENM